jgi:hypothetical protein
MWKRLAVGGLSYWVAVAAAYAVGCLIQLLRYRYAGLLLPTESMLVGAAGVGLLAFIPFLAIAAICRLFRLNGLLPHVAGGMLIGLAWPGPAWRAFALTDSSASTLQLLLQQWPAVIAGGMGGLVHWMVRSRLMPSK